MNASFKITNQNSFDKTKVVSIIKVLRSLSGMSLRDAKHTTDEMNEGKTVNLKSSGDKYMVAELEGYGITLCNQSTDEYVHVARSLVTVAISVGNYTEAAAIITALMIVDPESH